MQDLLANSPWWLAFGALLALALLFGGNRRSVTTIVCLAGIWSPRPVALLDGRPQHDHRRHRAGDDPGAGLRRLDGPQPCCRPRPPPGPGRGPDDPGLRLPDPRPGPVRPVALHRHRGGGHLRGACRHQAGCGRSQRGVDQHRRGRPLDRPDDVAGDHQGPAADGQGLTGVGHEPGPSLRPVDGRHRRLRRGGRARLRRQPGARDSAATSARVWRPDCPSSCSAIFIDRVSPRRGRRAGTTGTRAGASLHIGGRRPAIFTQLSGPGRF